MEAFTTAGGRAAALMRADIDTDALIPSREMTGTGRSGYGERLFANWRYLAPVAERRENPDFVLNQAPFRSAVVLLAGRNFGCGSSREHATWALRQFGVRVVVAASFGTIFRNNCHRNGILPVVLPEAVVEGLAAEAVGGSLSLEADLHTQRLLHPDGRSWAFDVPALERAMMLSGLDEIDRTLQRRPEIEAFRQSDAQARPWIYETGPTD